MIEELQPSRVNFKIYGPNAGATAVFAGVQFVDGITSVNKDDAVNIERAMRPYCACLESEWEANQAQYEKDLAESPAPSDETAEQLYTKEDINTALDKLRQELGEEFEETIKQAREQFEVDKAQIHAQYAESAKPATKEKVAGDKDNGTSKDNKGSK